MITIEQLIEICPTTNKKILEKYIDVFNEIARKRNLTIKQFSVFLSQILHESMDLKRLDENLNYSAIGLQTVFSKYFDKKTSKEFARKPEQIANIVYANRMGNGDTKSGDGSKYRGRGLIQLTGKNNYDQFAQDNHLTIENNFTIDQVFDYLTTPEGAVLSSVWFFDKNKLWNLDIKTSTRRINGGVNGLGDRIRKQEKIEQLLSKA
jgi:putative chitinase